MGKSNKRSLKRSSILIGDENKNDDFVIDNRSWIDSMQKQSQVSESKRRKRSTTPLNGVNVDHNKVSDSKRRKVNAANMSSVKFEEIDAGAGTSTRNKALKNIKREKSLKARVSIGFRKLNFNGESGMKIKKFKYENDAKDLIKKKIKKSIGNGSKTKHNVARYVKWRGIKTRSSPHQLNRCIAGLKEKQKLKIIEMGFGNLLSFKVDGIPAKLGHFVVDKFDPAAMEIRIDDVKISVDSYTIHTILGLPNVGLDILSLKKWNDKSSIRKKWEGRYVKENICTKMIVDNILESADDDSIMFVLDFLVLFCNSMFQIHVNGWCKLHVLSFVDEETDFAGLNWCRYGLSLMKKCKKNWDRASTKSFFCGPLTILTLLYVNTMTCKLNDECQVQPIKYWTFEKLSKREADELKRGGFGLGEVREVSNNRQLVAVDVNQTGHLKEHVGKMIEIVDCILKDRKLFEKFVVEANEKYPGNEEINELIEKYNGTCIRLEGVKEYGSNEKGIKPQNKEEMDDNEGKEYSVQDGNMQWTQFFEDNYQEIEDSVKKYDTGLVGIDAAILTFSLGLTQGCPSVEPNKIGLISSTPKLDTAPRRISPVKVGLYKRNPIRLRYLPSKLRSPILIRPTDMNKGVSSQEARIWNYLSDGKRIEPVGENRVDQEMMEVARDFGDQIFETNSGIGTTRFLMMSLLPEVEIESSVIDCWAAVLNYEERNRGSESLHGLFCRSCFITRDMLDGKRFASAARISLLRTNMLAIVDQDPSLLNLKPYDLVFFPIIENHHWYLMCFDLRHLAIIVIDNMHESKSPVGLKDDKDFDKKDTPMKVKHMFVDYLKSVGNEKWLALNQVSPHKLKIGWATKKNYLDCGVYVMKHMEKYKSSKEKNWDCGFKSEKSELKSQIAELRKNYAARILLSDINLHKGVVTRGAIELDNKVSH